MHGKVVYRPAAHAHLENLASSKNVDYVKRLKNFTELDGSSIFLEELYNQLSEIRNAHGINLVITSVVDEKYHNKPNFPSSHLRKSS